MKTDALKKEKRFLKMSSLGNFLIGCAGITVAVVSSSQAIMLDGLFNLTYCASGLFTVKVASLVAGGDDERFPHGYSFFEPLVNGIKGMLVLGVSVMALIGSIQALLSGGRSISAGFAVAYGIFASIVCWSVALLMRRGANTTDSPLVSADSENWLVNAAISSCVLLAFAGIFILEAFELGRFAPFVDPIVVLAVVTISITVPVRMAWNALMALLNKAPDGEILTKVNQIVDESLADLPLQERFIRVIQPGRQRMVLVHVVLAAGDQLYRIKDLDAIRMKIHQALRNTHTATFVDVLFTADRRWGAPLSDGEFGEPQGT
jgi:predicted Co/Zn/Cd cation transporter (cation efflux family)